MKRSFGLFLLCSAAALGVLPACDENPSSGALGSVALTTGAPTIESGFSTADGWNVKYMRFVVNVSATVAGDDGVVAVKSDPQIIDLAVPGAKTLLSEANRTARAWEAVSVEVGPATKDSSVVDPVTEADMAMFVTNAYSVYLEATMTKTTQVTDGNGVTAPVTVTKTLKLGYGLDTQFTKCTANIGNIPTPGLVVAKNGSDSAEIGFAGDVLFFDNLQSQGRQLRGDPLAAADANNDGLIDNTELSGVSVETARGGNNNIYNAPGIADLDAFVGAQTRGIVTTFRTTGTCTVTPVEAAKP